ncbi:MAG: dihydrofolate reductase family protein [Spirochaetota bacterium]
MRVVGIAVISLDGSLTRPGEDGVSFSSPEDQAHFRAALRGAGAAIMGRRTFEAEQEHMLSSLQADAQPTAPVPGAASSRRRPLERIVMTRNPARYASLVHPGRLEFSDESAAAILRRLEARGHETVLILGGTAVFERFVHDRLITEWQLTVEPRILGSATRLVATPADQELELVEHRLLNSSTVLLRYRVVKNQQGA